MKSIEEQILVAVMDDDMDLTRRLVEELTPAERQLLTNAAQVMATLTKCSTSPVLQGGEDVKRS